MVGVGRRLLQDGVGGDHLARDQVLADAEMLERALRLRAPELVGGNFDLAKAIGFLTGTRSCCNLLGVQARQIMHRRSRDGHHRYSLRLSCGDGQGYDFARE